VIRPAGAPLHLADLLRRRGLEPSTLTLVRNALAPELASADFATTADLARAGVLHLYDRMQDGPRIPHEARVLSFMALPDGRARLTAFRQFLMRRPGIAPGDIVYDHDAAHLLHAFIGHAANPVFYDVRDEAGLEDLVDRLEVDWPGGLDVANAAALPLAVRSPG
jgi:hypothetical protein